ncbi:hypothetical protein B0O99DRAFT_647339 [Bisporella sp. PMI_857]|nr:hypothetical protein B0O99DRAFT_647339 [Bisporella sp. PMI_857]
MMIEQGGFVLLLSLLEASEMVCKSTKMAFCFSATAHYLWRSSNFSTLKACLPVSVPHYGNLFAELSQSESRVCRYIQLKLLHSYHSFRFQLSDTSSILSKSFSAHKKVCFIIELRSDRNSSFK